MKGGEGKLLFQHHVNLFHLMKFYLHYWENNALFISIKTVIFQLYSG